jgi:ABC-type multidrug transport system fused ATPase/permease subunit
MKQAHGLSTVKNCDYIYVLENGGIIEEGSVHKLRSNTESHFYRMCEAQNLLN